MDPGSSTSERWRTGYKMCEHAGNISIFGLCCVNAHVNAHSPTINFTVDKQVPYQDRVSIEAIWTSLSSANTLDQQLQRFQKAWDSTIVKKVYHAIDASAISHAKQKSTYAPHSGDWLHAPQIASGELLLSDEEIRLAVAYRLGTRA